MLSLGNNISQFNDPLKKITIEYLVEKIKNPDDKFINFINQLRNLLSIDPKQYRQYKIRLPYVVAALFNPPYRKLENFAQTSFFILDIDHLSEKEFEIETLTTKLKNDMHLNLLFRSPSNDGLKLFFILNEPIFDSGKFSLFYKSFALKFGKDYNLNQVIDSKTSDVSRACFLSYDPDIYFNPKATPVNIDNFINFNNELEIKSLQTKYKEIENENATDKTADILSQNIPKEIIKTIREKLNPNLTIKKEKQIIVPEELNTIIELIKIALKEYNIEIFEIVNINYGKQFRLKLENYKAEINVFYGKKGYSIVKSTKSGCNKELVDIAHSIISSTIL